MNLFPPDALECLHATGAAVFRVPPDSGWSVIQEACSNLLDLAAYRSDGTDECYGVNHVWLGHGSRRSDGRISLGLHQEGYDEFERPRYIAFHCLEPGEGGATTYADVRRTYLSLSKERRRSLGAAQLRFCRRRDEAPAWSDWFPIVEAQARGENVIRFAEREIGIREVDVSDANCGFPELQDRVRLATQAHRWRAGDLLLLDNFRMVHGREAIRSASPRHLVRFAFG